MSRTPRLAPAVAAWPVLVLTCHYLSAAPLGTYRTAPGATAIYTYQPGDVTSVVLPVDVTMTFTGSPATLSATIHRPLIGALANGTPIYPIGGTFPRTVAAQSTDNRRFTGTLESQYLFDWTIDAGPGGELAWSGVVAWAGGRLEHTAISDVRLTLIPEPSASGGMMLAMLALACRRRLRCAC